MEIDEIRCGGGMRTMRISGFRAGELRELKSMEHREAKEKVLEMLDRRNNNTGTCWARGYGVYGMWFDQDSVYLNIGTSSD